MLYHHTVVIKERREDARDVPAELLCHDVISLECGRKHSNVTSLNERQI